MKEKEDNIAKIAKALSDKTRIKILKEIAQTGGFGLTCSAAEEISGLSQPTVSHHLKILVDAGLLHYEKSGRCVVVSINKETLNEFSSLIAESFKDS